MTDLTIALDAFRRNAHSWAKAVNVFSGDEADFAARGSSCDTDKFWRVDNDGAVASSRGGSK